MLAPVLLLHIEVSPPFLETTSTQSQSPSLYFLKSEMDAEKGGVYVNMTAVFNGIVEATFPSFKVRTCATRIDFLSVFRYSLRDVLVAELTMYEQ